MNIFWMIAPYLVMLITALVGWFCWYYMRPLPSPPSRTPLRPNDMYQGDSVITLVDDNGVEDDGFCIGLVE